jgi:hypothetical protein
MNHWMRSITFLLASLCVAALLWITWEIGRLSRWVIPNDRLWSEMDNTGHVHEHYVLEAFHSVYPGVLWIEAMIGGVFLVMLYRILFLAPGFVPNKANFSEHVVGGNGG